MRPVDMRLPGAQLRHFGLHAAETGIDPVAFDKVVVRAHLGQFAFVKDQQAVGIFERR